MIKALKKTLALLITAMLFTASIANVDAKAIMDYQDQSIVIIPDSGGGGGGTGAGTGDCASNGRTVCDSYTSSTMSRKYEVKLSAPLYSDETTTITVYDMKDRDIINADTSIDQNNLPLAGTAIGLNIHEHKKLYAYVTKITVRIYEQKETIIKYDNKYKCTFTTKPIYWLPGIIIGSGLGAILPNNMTQTTRKCDRDVEIVDNKNCNILEPSVNPNDNYCMLLSGPTLYESIPREEIITKPDKVFSMDVTTTVDGRLTPARTSFSKDEFGLNDIDFENVAKNIEKVTKKFFTSTALTNAYYTNASYQASYDISLSNSNDVNDPAGVRLTQSRANGTAKFYDHNQNFMNCSGWKGGSGCGWKYTEGGVIGDTYHFGSVAEPGGLYDMRYIEMEYRMGKTCINVKTGDVRYLTTGSESCSADEFVLSNTTIGDEEHWHYFIPLNTKSDNGILVQMHPAISNSGLNTNTCLNVLDKNYIIKEGSGQPASGKTPYTNVIKPKNSEMFFVGDYYCVENCGTPDAIFNTNSKDYQSVINNAGCYKRSVIDIPVNQMFYNEVSTGTGKMLKGFNFYYQPINIYNNNQVSSIFPNGISTDLAGNITTKTLWKEWYNAKTNPTFTNDTPDLSKSFDEVTYVAQNISVVKVRNYKEQEINYVKNSYTSWNNMNINGTSNFITSEGIVERKVNPTTIYKLGCGPLNSNKYLTDQSGNTLYDASGNPLNNILYNTECAP